MHYHCEVIMPPSRDIQETLEKILSKFDKNNLDGECPFPHAFFDWFVVGGRWAGAKESCRFDPGKLEQFYKDLKAARVTISSIRFGKQAISPASQIPMVDKMWNDLFPTENGEITPCPIFAHSNNQYDGNDLLACDICRVDEIPETLKCNRVIIAGPSPDGNTIQVKFMLCDEQWNGINFMPINWDGLVKTAIKKFAEEAVTLCRAEYVEKITPKPDWICVTVDYHS